MRIRERVKLRRNWAWYSLVVWLIAISPVALASNPISGRLIGIEPIDALRMEDHSGAFIAWRQAKVKQRKVVHIDSHIDLEWVSDPDLKRILNSKTTKELQQVQLDPLHPEERSSKPLSIMNYLYPAIREGMVKELYWVPPDSLMGEASALDKLKNYLIESLSKFTIDDLNSFRLQKGVIKGKVYGIPITVCKLSDLPHFDEAVLLDVDVDYFDPPDLKKRIEIPTIWSEEFVAALTKKGMKSDLISICYSVKGGYLALEYRFLGDELANILKDPRGDNPIMTKMRGHRRSGAVYRSEGMYIEAINELQKALELAPNDASLHYWLGLVYGQSAKPDQASIEFARSTAMDPIYGNPLVFDGDYYFNKKIYEKALPLYEEILKKESNYLKGILGAGLCSSKLGKPDKAAEYYRRFVDLYPNFYLVHFNMGVIYSQLGRWEKVEEEYKRALELNPYYGKAYQNLGNFYADRGETAKAIKTFEKAAENNPCFKVAHNNLGTLFAGIGEYDEAVNEFRKVVKIDPYYAPGYSNLGKAYLVQGNVSNALEAFQRALSIDKGEGVDVNSLLKLAEKVVNLKPTAQSFGLLALLYSKKGMHEEAEKAIKRALELAPRDESIVRLREQIVRKK